MLDFMYVKKLKFLVPLSDHGHRATTPACIYGKNPSKSSSPETVDRFQRDLVCSITVPGPSQFVQMMNLG